MSVVRERLAQAGVPAFFVEEAATSLIEEGISPTTLGTMALFQTRVAALQIARETAACTKAASLEARLQHNAKDTAGANPTETVVICDRGICDGAAYLDQTDYLYVLEDNGLDHNTAMQRYDAVFCLESTAKMAGSTYTTANNTARSETAEEAAALDDRTAAAWREHPHFHFIKNEAQFDTKAEALVNAILREVASDRI